MLEFQAWKGHLIVMVAHMISLSSFHDRWVQLLQEKKSQNGESTFEHSYNRNKTFSPGPRRRRIPIDPREPLNNHERLLSHMGALGKTYDEDKPHIFRAEKMRIVISGQSSSLFPKIKRSPIFACWPKKGTVCPKKKTISIMPLFHGHCTVCLQWYGPYLYDWRTRSQLQYVECDHKG